MTPRQIHPSGETIDLASVRVRLTAGQIATAIVLVVSMISGAASSAWWLAARIDESRAEVAALREEISRQWIEHERRITIIETRVESLPAGGRR